MLLFEESHHSKRLDTLGRKLYEFLHAESPAAALQTLSTFAGDIANSRDSLSPFSRRSIEKGGPETNASRLRRSQPNMSSMCATAGPLSARGPPRTSLISPRPRAAWL